MPEVERSPDDATIRVVVVYAQPRCAHWFEVRVAAGSTVRQAIEACAILDAVPELAGGELDVGVFGQACRLDDRAADGDRIEIYRPLAIDPKEARRRRAALNARPLKRSG
jgi:putative ubiquitin-RnfH superfamily antitoxin RatB of RatAB toxin-antitoxin module